MTVEEARAWVCPDSDPLRAQYPTLALHDERVQAWLRDNREIIEEALAVCIANDRGFNNAPPLSRTSSGSLFEICRRVGYVSVYWDPPIIRRNYEGTTYIVSTPEHVAALHTIRDWPTALAYLLAHYDSRKAVSPLVLIAHYRWRPDTVVPWPRDAQRKNMVRYTLYSWHKHQEYARQPDWIACQHYFSEHYDLKEVVDPEGRVVSSELGEDCLDLARL